MSEFDRFYAEYPNKTQGPATARKKWEKMKLNDLASTIIEDVKARRDRDKKWLAGYVPLPSTYLNQRRWEGEIDEEKLKPPPINVFKKDKRLFDDGPKYTPIEKWANRQFSLYLIGYGPIGDNLARVVEAKNTAVADLEKKYAANEINGFEALRYLMLAIVKAHKPEQAIDTHRIANRINYLKRRYSQPNAS